MSDDIFPDKKESKLINLCGLWKRTSLAGNPYLRGRLGNATVLVMPNRYKTQENQPDLIMYLAPPPPRVDSEKDAGATVDVAAAEAAPATTTPGLDDDMIPF